MSKIVVKVYLPQIRKSYDVRISTDAFVSQITAQMTLHLSRMKIQHYVMQKQEKSWTETC